MPIPKPDPMIVVALLKPGVTADNQRHRRQRGQAIEAPGWLQPVADRLVEELAERVDKETAAGITAKSLPAWSDFICLKESGDKREFFIIIAVLGDDNYQIGVGELETEIVKVPRMAKSVLIVDLNNLLAELRRDARDRGVELPERLTPPLGSFEYVQWRAHFDSYEHHKMVRELYERQRQMRAKGKA